MSELPRAVGVIGAGTMGAGIAQLACLAGFDTFLHDPFPEALERGGERAAVVHVAQLHSLDSRQGPRRGGLRGA